MNKSYTDLCLICHCYFPVFSKGMRSPVGCMSLMKACYQEQVKGVINITYILMIQSLITPQLTADKINNFIFLQVMQSLRNLYLIFTISYSNNIC